MSRFGSLTGWLGCVCLLVLVLSSSVVASGKTQPDSSFTVADFMNMFYYEYAVDSIGGEPWVYLSVRPPHTEDESALEEIGEFLSRRDDGPGLYRVRVRDLPQLYSYPEVKFTFCKGVRTHGSRDERSRGERGSIQLTIDLPTGVSLPGYTVRFYRAEGLDALIDSTDQIRQRFWQAYDLRSGVSENGLPAGEYACYLVAPLVDFHSEPDLAKVVQRCSDIFISGIVVEEGSTTGVRVTYRRFETRGESIMRAMGDELAIRHTDSGDYLDVLIRMAEGSTFYQLDSAGVKYHEWGEGLYSAEVPVAQAFELGALSSIAWLGYGRTMHLAEDRWTDLPNLTGTMELTVNVPPNVSSPRYTLRIFRVDSASSVIDTTEQVHAREYDAEELRRGIKVGYLHLGYYQCCLTPTAVDSVGEVCPEVFITGVLITAKCLTKVSVPDSLFGTGAVEKSRSRSRCVMQWKMKMGENYMRMEW